MSIVKLAASSLMQMAPIQGGAHSNKKNAWKHSKALSGRSDLPLAIGINKFAKLALKGATKSELNAINNEYRQTTLPTYLGAAAGGGIGGALGYNIFKGKVTRPIAVVAGSLGGGLAGLAATTAMQIKRGKLNKTINAVNRVKRERRKSMSIVKHAASNYMGSVYERAADQLAIDNATERELGNVKGPYATSGITLGALGALAGGYASARPGVGAAIGGSLGLLSGLALAYGIKRGRAQELALSKNKELAKKHALLQKLQQIEMASNPHYYYY